MMLTSLRCHAGVCVLRPLTTGARLLGCAPHMSSSQHAYALAFVGVHSVPPCPPTNLTPLLPGTATATAIPLPPGTMLCGLGEFRSVSALALTVLRQRNPQRRACDGWKEVRVPAAHGGQAGQGQGQGVRLDQLRLRALAMQAAEDVEAGAGAERQSGRGTGSRAGLRPVLEEQGSGEEEGGG